MKRAMGAVAIAAAVVAGGVTGPGVAHADGIFSAMNPMNWFFGDDHDDYWYYRRHRYGWGGPWGGPYGWGGPWAAGAYARPQTVIVLPSEDSAKKSDKVAATLPNPE
jgi:hypothetical protein